MGDNTKWQSNFEDMNAQKLQQLQNSIIVASKQLEKGSSDVDEKVTTLGTEVKLIENAL